MVSQILYYKKERTVFNMKTPKSFITNLNNDIITYEMLGASVFSCNKRAKNYRDKARSYRDYKYKDIATENKQAMYEKKEKLLEIIPPTCIHKTLENHYDYYTEISSLTDTYYLNYDVYGYNFHSSPDYHNSLTNNPKYKDLAVIDIGSLNTYGENYTDLISMQFVDKLLDKIETGNFKLAFATPDKILNVDYQKLYAYADKYKKELPNISPASFSYDYADDVLADMEVEERIVILYVWNQIIKESYRPYRLDGIIVPEGIKAETIDEINDLYDKADKDMRLYGILFPDKF